MHATPCVQVFIFALLALAALNVTDLIDIITQQKSGPCPPPPPTEPSAPLGLVRAVGAREQGQGRVCTACQRLWDGQGGATPSCSHAPEPGPVLHVVEVTVCELLRALHSLR